MYEFWDKQRSNNNGINRSDYNERESEQSL